MLDPNQRQSKPDQIKLAREKAKQLVVLTHSVFGSV